MTIFHVLKYPPNPLYESIDCTGMPKELVTMYEKETHEWQVSISHKSLSDLYTGYNRIWTKYQMLRED